MTTSSRGRWMWVCVFWVVAISALLMIAIPARHAEMHLGNPSIITGYSLLSLILLLASFNLRKRVPVLPLIRAHWWTTAHLIGGVAAGVLYFLHTETVWPNGWYEQALALFVYLVFVSGIVGYAIERIYPRRLTGTGVEIIYERIPAELADIREQAEQLILSCIKESRSDTVARYYVETFDWFFRRPRFLFGHLTGAQTSKFWLEREFNNSRNYINDVEQNYLARLEKLAEYKSDIDFHYAAQRLMKIWLLVHVPAAVGLILLALWHLLLVNVYIL